MKNNIILCANVKGGVGKTVLSGLIASYLVQQGVPVAVVDADIQQSLFRHRERELAENPDVNIPWQIVSLANFDEVPVSEAMQNLKTVEGCVVIDSPGNIQDENLKYIYNAADIVIVPTRYDGDTLDATKRFLDVFTMVSNAEVFIVPNNIVLTEERRDSVKEERFMAKKLLEKYGTITPRIKQSVVFHTYSTVNLLTYYQRKGVEHAFEPIVNAIKGIDDGKDNNSNED